MARVCVIIPCYNEEQRIPLADFKKFADQHQEFDFCFVNDGSQDHTGKVLQQFAETQGGRFFFYDQQPNQGKAEAVRNGINHILSMQASYDVLGFLDADLATPLAELPDLLGVMQKYKQVQMVMGIRLKRLGANVQRKNTRHYMGRVFATVVSVAFDLPVYDSQCGAKLFTSGLASQIFKESFNSRWLFDVEMILRVRKVNANYAELICEHPLNEWIEKGGSKIRFAHLLRMPRELFKIYRRYR